VQDAPGLTAQERHEMRKQMDCYALGAVARKVAYERDEFHVTEEEALSNVAQVMLERLQTTATPAVVRATGMTLNEVVYLVYIPPKWTPDEAAFHTRNICLGNPYRPYTPR
jgi:hypothetical protein